MMREHARVQARCTALLQAQARQIAALDAQVVRLRAAVVARDSQLAWEREDRAALEREMPGLEKRSALARRVQALQVRIEDLLRERPRRRSSSPTPAPAPAPAPVDDAERLEERLSGADLVICQTGCLSHGDYWRVQDHCKRTGTACVLVERPDALRIVRIHRAPDDEGRARIATLPPECVE
ncbi:DUF2325 domain-containing protein [Massilia sp. YIM B02763]|uniref:DUF2325 domain-containing protein n=1 Tax=Massilia sp. YIM B02763 TaxID=3050130 RepID=UPI0025B67025|nr:DUF2325 domain-containing protein [Massilia sp. YIM B02763]MDN4054663.1 DUF2325 domain-containing protein [Massilia sp. YIM B02763]